MRSAYLLLLSMLLTVTASAQSFEQLGFLRLNDTTPRTTRTVALGGASDPAEGDLAANPATLAAVRRPALLLQAARNSVAITRFSIAGNNVPEQHLSWVEGTSLSYIAAAVPFREVVIGAYYASEPRLQGPDPLVTSFGSAPYVGPACPNGCQYLLPVANTSFERGDRRYGLALAWERGALAFGAGVELQQLDERSEIGRSVFPLSPTFVPIETELLFRRIDDRALVPNAGIRWRVTPRIALAAAYNGAGSFTRTTSACTVQGYEWSRCVSSAAPIGQSTVHMPDAYRAAVSFAATDRLRLIGEAVRRNYGNLAQDGYTIMGDAQVLPYRDVMELHAGAEYRLPWLPVALRAGWWRDPSRYISRFVAAGDTVRHYTVGAGIDIGGARLDLAYDDADVPLQRRAVAGIAFGLPPLASR